MAQAARPQQAEAQRSPGSRTGSGGGQRPVGVYAAVTVLLGTVALLTGLLTQFEVADLHLAASWAGLVGVVVGGWGQYVSDTLAQRFVLIISLGAAGFGLFLGMFHGGPFGGLVG